MNTIFSTLTTQSRPGRSAVVPRYRAALGVILAASLAGCGDPPVDSNSPAPTGIIRGTVQYIGRRVDCEYAEDGSPTSVRGVLMLTLLDDDNPLPPQGTATMPVDLKAVGGEDMFTDLGADCLPSTGEPDPLNPIVIQRSYSFEWRRIALGPAIPAENAGLPENYEVHYRIVATYDQTGDFNPLFDVTQAPNSGDVAGAALENPLGGRAFHVIKFDSRSIARLGQVREGINVTLGAVVATDAPLMRISEGDLSSQFPWAGVTTPAASYPPLGLRMYGRAAGMGDRVALDATLAALELSNQYTLADPIQYSWYIEPIDVDNDGNADCASAGDLDCHPLFGNFGSAPTWNTPVVFLQRAQNAIETAAGVPSVAFIPGSGIEAGHLRSQHPDLTMRIFPIATLLTNPAVPECRMLYFADGASASNTTGIGAFASLLPEGTAAECSELPTGFYGTNVLTGFAIQSPNQIAAGDPVTETNMGAGYVINGGNFSSQLWALPNSLGDWRQVGDELAPGGTDRGAYTCLDPASVGGADPAICLPEQGIGGAFVVADPDPSNPVGRNDPNGAGGTCSAYAGALATNRWADNPSAPMNWGDLCCAPIRHLCGLPLCPMIEGGVTQTWSDEAAEMNMNVRSQPTAVTGHVNVRIGNTTVRRDIPDCVAFPMPSQCCTP